MTKEMAIRLLRGDILGTTEQTHEAVKMAIVALTKVPSAEKTGKWIRITQGADPEKYMCPFCHRTVEDYGPDCMVSIRYPYCHCGARMDLED